MNNFFNPFVDDSNGGGGGGGIDTSDATALAKDIKQGATAYARGIKLTGSMPTTQGGTITPSTTKQTINGNAYLEGDIEVVGDADLIADNIKKNVNIFGVVGTLESLDTSDATATAGDIMAGETAYVNGTKITGNYVPLDTSDANAQSSDILDGKSAYVNGSKITGSIPSKAAATYIPSTTDQQITSGQYLSGNQTIKGDANLISDNIKGGIIIFGVSGNGNVMDTTEPSSTTASSSNVQTGMSAYVNGVKIVGAADPLVQSGDNVTYTPTTTDQVIQGPRILQGNKTMTIKGDADLIPANIRKDVEIFGVTGTLDSSSSGYDTSDATATAADIMSGETAYINGGKVTGTYIPLDTSDADATAADMKAGVTAYVNGQKITGNAYTRTSQVNAVADGLIDGRAHWLQAGFYNGIAFEAEPDLIAANIKSGVTIYGVTGTYAPSIVTNVLLDTESATSAADIVSAYSSDIEVSYDGTFGTWETLNEYNYDNHPIGAYYSSSYKGIFYAHANRQNSGILFTDPIDMAAHFIIKYKYYVSTWINPIAQLYLISATSLSDAKQKLVDNDIAYSIPLSCANVANNSYVLVEREGVAPGSYYICYCQPSGTGGNEAVLTDLSIIQL